MLNDGVEADMIATVLENNGIPVLKKRPETGDYLNIYMGMSVYGVDIYVPSEFYDFAKEILENIPKAEQNEIAEEEFVEFIEKENFKRRIKIWTIIAVFAGPGVILLALHHIFFR